MRIEVGPAAVKRPDQARRPGLALVLAVALVGSPSGAQPIAGVGDGVLQARPLGELVLVLAFPSLAGATTTLLPPRTASREELRTAVLARIQVEDLLGDVAQERAVVTDDGQPAGVGT